MPVVGSIALFGLSAAGRGREEDRTIMALIDRHYLARPYYGSRRMVNRKRVRRLMRLMGLVAIYQRPNTSKPAPQNKVCPSHRTSIRRP